MLKLTVCAIPGCEKDRVPGKKYKYKSRYCSTHCHPMTRWGKVRPGKKRVALFGKPWLHESGHLKIRFLGKAFYVHQIVDAITNGPIPKGWDVHHKDHVPTHNHWDNLQRMPHEQHTALHKGAVC